MVKFSEIINTFMNRIISKNPDNQIIGAFFLISILAY
jgi:hypothetical protein